MSRPYTDVIGDLNSGATAQEITDLLHEVVEAVAETRKVGSLTVQLKVKPNGENSVFITSEIKAKVPELTRGDTLFFVSADGSLRRTDPRQQDLPLREVPAVNEEPKEVPSAQ